MFCCCLQFSETNDLGWKVFQRFEKEVLQEFNSKYSFKKDFMPVENGVYEVFVMTAEAHGFHLQ